MVTKFLRHFKLAVSFFKVSIITAMEFRINFLAWSLLSIFWASLLFIATEWTFGEVTSIAGWTKYEIMFIISIYLLFTGVLNSFIVPSLQYLSQTIRDGTMDFYIIKPVNVRFLMSVMKFSFDYHFKNVLSLVVVFYFLGKLQVSPNLGQWLAFGMMSVLGLAVFYNLFFIATTTSFWLINTSNLDFLFAEIMDAGKYPVNIFRGGLKVVFYYLLPIGFIASFPASILLGKFDYSQLFYLLLFAGLTAFISQKFWNFALKHYSSASS